MVLGELIGHDPVPPFELPRRSCFENDLYALPAGRISGKVVGPDGNPLPEARVDLYRAGRYKEGERGGIYSFQGKARPVEEWKAFGFYHLTPDDYVLVFNSANAENPDAPFPITFYPSASSLQGSQLIHLSDGQELLDADIHVSNRIPTRQITVRFDWSGRMPTDFFPPHVIAEASRGTAPYPVENGPDTYSLNLLLSAQYTIHAEAYCHLGTTGKVETAKATVDGGSVSVSEVTLKFDKGGCVRK
jgi:hypothetical protein